MDLYQSLLAGPLEAPFGLLAEEQVCLSSKVAAVAHPSPLAAARTSVDASSGVDLSLQGERWDYALWAWLVA